jgi:hypothetical protein
MSQLAPTIRAFNADLTVFQALPADMLQRELANIWVKIAASLR